MMILSVLVYFWGMISDGTRAAYRRMETSKIAKFNQQFLNYEDNSLSAQDVATIINLARNHNKNPEYGGPIKVHINGSATDWGDITKEDKTAEHFLEDPSNCFDVTSGENIVYKCENIHINSNTSVVDKISIKK